MPMIQWNNTLSLGIEEIDGQHQQLIGIINALYDAMCQDAETTVLASIIQQMRHYTDHHFHDEETLMARIHYPQLEDHQAQHGEFCEKLHTFEQAYQKNDKALAMDILNFLSDWLVSHINESDRDIACHLQNV